MFIGHKSNTIQVISDVEWICRSQLKGQTPEEYWAWVKTKTTVSGTAPDTVTTVDFSGETEYTIVECKIDDEDIEERLKQLGEYITDQFGIVSNIYNIKWQDDIGNAEEILDADGSSFDPKQYVQSHLVPDDTAKDKRISDDEWIHIRKDRDRLLVESDWTQANDTPLASGKVTEWGTYRTSLRDLPSDQSSKTKYSDITWPTKP